MTLEYVSEWFVFADSDLAAAEFLQGMYPLPMEIICYHCEQAAEKYLKGYLVYRGVVDFPKTHNLIYLCERCSDFDEHFNEIARACGVLTRYGVQPRYPHEMGLREMDVQKALEYARCIRQFEPLFQVRNEIDQNCIERHDVDTQP